MSIFSFFLFFDFTLNFVLKFEQTFKYATFVLSPSPIFHFTVTTLNKGTAQKICENNCVWVFK